MKIPLATYPCGIRVGPEQAVYMRSRSGEHAEKLSSEVWVTSVSICLDLV